jgi:hypothetical protein
MFNFKSLALKVTTFAFVLISFQSAQAAEVNMPGLSGSLTTTLTSGFSMRVAARDCQLLDGYNTNEYANAGTQARRNARGEDSSLDYIDSGSLQGCASARTDNYGNTTNKVIDIGGSQNNDGNLNFDKGDIFSATQAIYSSFSGSTDSGIDIDFSFTANVDPALDINAPAFKTWTSKAEKDFESDITLLDFYVSGSEDFGDSYIDYSLGRFVTSWGESTFIPVGMNGMVTNPLDLNKLISPSSGIKEALMPVEALSIATGLSDGSSLEAYYQFQHHKLKIPASGSFFGSETFGPGAHGLIATGPNRGEGLTPAECPILMTNQTDKKNAIGVKYSTYGFVSGINKVCNSTNANTYALNKTGNTWQSFSVLQLAKNAFAALDATSAATAIAVGKAHQYDTTDSASAGVIAANAGDSAGITAMLTSMAALPDPLYDNGGTVFFRESATTGLFKDPKDGGQYGLKWSKYLDDVGTGLDLGVYFANYHSKVPYIQFSMPGGFFASDALGVYLASTADLAGTLAGSSAGSFEYAGYANAYAALLTAGASSGVCGAVTKKNLATAHGYSSTASTSQEQAAAMNASFRTEFGSDGTLAYDSSACLSWALGNAGDADGATFTSLPDLAATTGVRSSGTYASVYTATASALASALVGTGARLFAAVTPMSFIDYTGIFPEDLKVLAISASSNISGTTVQGEIAYRPNFPLATGASNQINQLNDKNGANDALNMVSVAGIRASAAGIAALQSIEDAVGGNQAYYAGVGAYERSDLGKVLDANGNDTDDLNSRYYSRPFIRYDVISGTFGTTTSFGASHPVTTSIGADSTVLLTELGFVNINGLNNAKYGHVARGGWNEGVASGTSKCLGAFGTANTGLAGAAAPITNLGSGVVDALFGNGGYCESQPGADSFSATYRIVAFANYNNINNTPWSFSPNFAMSNDFTGYGPSSLGGFIEGRQSMSLGASFNKNDLKVSVSYTDFFGDTLSQLNADKDNISASVSYAF